METCGLANELTLSWTSKSCCRGSLKNSNTWNSSPSRHGKCGHNGTRFACINLVAVLIWLLQWQKTHLQNSWLYNHLLSLTLLWHVVNGDLQLWVWLTLILMGPFSPRSTSPVSEWWSETIKVHCWPRFQSSCPRFIFLWRLKQWQCHRPFSLLHIWGTVHTGGSKGWFTGTHDCPGQQEYLFCP